MAVFRGKKIFRRANGGSAGRGDYPHNLPNLRTDKVSDIDWANPHGIPRPDLTGVTIKDDNDFATGESEEDPNPLDPWAPEDIEEETNLRDERNKRGYF